MVMDGRFRAANNENMPSHMAWESGNKRFASTKRMAWWRMAGSVPQIASFLRVVADVCLPRLGAAPVEKKNVGRESIKQPEPTLKQPKIGAS